jgi:hypothetical protein
MLQLLCSLLFVFCFTVEAECEPSKKATCQNQKCAKVNGTDTCSCDPGYQLAADGTTCTGKCNHPGYYI